MAIFNIDVGAATFSVVVNQNGPDGLGEATYTVSGGAVGEAIEMVGNFNSAGVTSPSVTVESGWSGTFTDGNQTLEYIKNIVLDSFGEFTETIQFNASGSGSMVFNIKINNTTTSPIGSPSIQPIQMVYP